MANQSNQAKTTVDGMIKQVTTIISVGGKCRRLESEEEKVLPFYTSCLSREEEEGLAKQFGNEEDETIRTVCLNSFCLVCMFIRVCIYYGREDF